MTANFWRLCREVDARNARRAREQAARRVADEETFRPAQSTIDALKWLRKFHSDQLEQFYAKRDPRLRDWK
jgi:hypothetical protein